MDEDGVIERKNRDKEYEKVMAVVKVEMRLEIQ